MTAMIYLAIWKDDEKTVVIEYQPAHYSGPAPANAIEILSIDIQYKPRSPFQIRETERRQKGKLYHKAQRTLSDEEEYQESMLPTTRHEQLKLFDR